MLFSFFFWTIHFNKKMLQQTPSKYSRAEKPRSIKSPQIFEKSSLIPPFTWDNCSFHSSYMKLLREWDLSCHIWANITPLRFYNFVTLMSFILLIHLSQSITEYSFRSVEFCFDPKGYSSLYPIQKIIPIRSTVIDDRIIHSFPKGPHKQHRKLLPSSIFGNVTLCQSYTPSLRCLAQKSFMLLCLSDTSDH